jgi:hypothetical protein
LELDLQNQSFFLFTVVNKSMVVLFGTLQDESKDKKETQLEWLKIFISFL